MARQENDINSYNIISAGTVISGEFSTPGNIRIDGSFEGTISTEGKLIVGTTGSIKGKIFCQNAEFEGQITADVEVQQLLALKASAKLVGDVKTDKICIETGAIFIGQCKMPENKQIELNV